MKTKYETVLKTEQHAIKNISKVLNKKIIIQKYDTVTNDNGFEEEKWVDWTEVWASKNNLSGKEYFAAKQFNEEKTVKFEVRYQKLLDELNSTKYRIIHDGKIYDITYIDNFQYRNEWLVIKTLENGIWQE
ncbi:phage head closure protein [Sedimentibacter hydroxybenzoicus DSM 7310]|uniref:Phage head closure protein n=1 Tax=Sedimentibacter hydroxybenzoicus DSM 7310 TaxID=1123245 RepID=A0A974BIQ9_SEDHY|nr:phage head closure protein [Sedimentibacter hydroxybenzoicus]NYB73857.1 phage head closure protein [Sedimentibacter hydroxybenzoicus DSM 7310]